MSEDNQDIWSYVDPETDPTLIQTKIGTFGGPNDKEDNGKFAYGGGSIMPDGSINPENYAALDKHLYDIGLVHPGMPFDVTNPRTGQTITVIARDSGPSPSTGRGLDLAPHAAKMLGLETNDNVVIDAKQFMANKQVTPHPQGNPSVNLVDEGNPSVNLVPENQGDAIRQTLSDVPQQALIAGEPTQASAEYAAEPAQDLSSVAPPDMTDPSQAIQPDEAQSAQSAPKEDNFVMPTLPANVTAVQIPGTNTYKLSNGYTYNKDTQTVTYPDGVGNIWMQQRGQKPVKANPPAASKDYQVINDANTGQHFRYDKSTNTAVPIELPQTNTGIPEGVTGEDALKGQPAQDVAIAKKIANYEIPLPSGFALRSPYWQKIMGLASAYDPSFDAKEYGIKMNLRKDFTSGADAKNIASLNTAVQHLNELKQASDGLNNADWQPYNTVANYIIQQRGDPRVTRFNAAATAVQNELATVFKGTGGTDQEIKQWRDNLSSSQSPKQLHSSIDEALTLMSGRLNALQNKYAEGLGKPADFNMISPKSREILGQFGEAGKSVLNADSNTSQPSATTSATAPNATPVISDPQSYNALPAGTLYKDANGIFHRKGF